MKPEPYDMRMDKRAEAECNDSLIVSKQFLLSLILDAIDYFTPRECSRCQCYLDTDSLDETEVAKWIDKELSNV